MRGQEFPVLGAMAQEGQLVQDPPPRNQAVLEIGVNTRLASPQDTVRPNRGNGANVGV